MRLSPSHVGEQPLELHDELPPSVLELNDETSQANHPVKAELMAMLSEEKQIIITGTLSTQVKLLCGRCATWIDWKVEVPDFTMVIEPPFPPTLELNDAIREEILLALPQTAACKLGADFRCPYSGKSYPEKADSPESLSGQESWHKLDQLKLD